MKNTDKILLILGMILILLGIFFIIFDNPITAQAIESRYSYTKALCDENNFCQDYEIVCLNGEVVSTQAISGAIIQQPSTWEDARKNKSEIICE